MAEAPIAKPNPNWSTLFPTVVALFTVSFTTMGFLATRSYLSGIGIPEHVDIPVNGYLQYGGRFFFVLAVHVLPVSVCAGLIFMIGEWLTKWARLRKLWETGLFICLVLGAVAFATVSLELSTLQPEPVFSPGRVHDITGEARSMLFLIELGVATSIAWLVRQLDLLWIGFRSTLFQKALLTIALFSVLVEVLLFPLCFGRVAMIPKSFDHVTIRRENEPANLKGILVYSDSDSYFLFTEERRLVEVSHRTIKEVQYDHRELLANLAMH